MSRNKIVYETELDTSGVKKGSADIKKSLKQTEGDVNDLSDGLDKMTGGLVSGLKGAVTGTKTFVKGLKSVKIGIASTGIGLLVIAVTSLVLYFTKTRKGAELLEIATASLGAIIGKLTDLVSGLGGELVAAFRDPKKALIEFGTSIKTYVLDNVQKMMDGLGFLGSAIKKVFSGDFSGAMDDATKGAAKLADGFIHLNPVTAVAAVVLDEVLETVKELGPEIIKASKAAARLQRRSIDLREAQRGLNVEYAEGQARIKELNLIGEDTSNQLEDRIKATEDAMAIEIALTNKRKANAKEELDIHKAQMAITESTEEDYVKLNELEVALIELRTQSAEMQTTLNNKLQTMRTQELANIEAIQKAEQDLLNLQLNKEEQLDLALSTAEEKEIAAVVKKYEALFALSDEFGRGEEALQEQQREALKKINDKYNKTEVTETAKTEKTKQELRMQTIDKVNKMSQAAAGLALALLKGGEEADEATAKKRFETGKKIQLAAAVMSTAQAVIAALSAPPVGLGFPAGLPGAITAGITGATSIATISQQRFSGGPSDIPDPTSAPPPDASIADVAAQSPSINLDFLGDGSSQSGIRAYVVSQNITDAQQSEQLLNDQMSLA